MRVTFVIPSLNERDGIARTLDLVPQATLKELGHDVDVIVVDGDSKDGTAEVARAAGATVITEKRLGYGRAYKTGFRAATGDVIVTGDADGSYPLEDAIALLELLETKGFDFLTSNRYARMHPGAMSGMHKVGNWVLNVTSRALFGIKIQDTQSGMWLFRRRVLDLLPYEAFSDKMPFSEELKIRAFQHPKIKAAEVDGRYLPRTGEAKLSSWKDGYRNLKHLFRLRFQRRPKVT
ncbi:MAG TPA: glycosyltransferase family 2 protein [Candidatus Thermoplasmatota archaeon]|nr:glycosyltransferase family 2 protein [Candidatus Thermoplasmatota archaeon]